MTMEGERARVKHVWPPAAAALPPTLNPASLAHSSHLIFKKLRLRREFFVLLPQCFDLLLVGWDSQKRTQFTRKVISVAIVWIGIMVWNLAHLWQLGTQLAGGDSYLFPSNGFALASRPPEETEARLIRQKLGNALSWFSSLIARIWSKAIQLVHSLCQWQWRDESLTSGIYSIWMCMAVARNLCVGRQGKRAPEARVTRGLGACSPRKFGGLKALKCHFRRSFQVLTWSW